MASSQQHTTLSPVSTWFYAQSQEATSFAYSRKYAFHTIVRTERTQMTIRCVLFDSDGVMSFMPEFFSDWYCKKYDLPPAEMNQFFKGPFQKCLTGHADLKEELTPLLASWKWTKYHGNGLMRVKCQTARGKLLLQLARAVGI